MFKKKTYSSLEDRVAASTQALNTATVAADEALCTLGATAATHYELGDEINSTIESTQRAAELRVQQLREIQQNAYLHADDTVRTYL